MPVCNIKLSLFFKNDFFKKIKSNQKVISKVKNLVITQYMHSPNLINLTGIKSKEEINFAISLIEEKFKNKCLNYRIDSIMISHKDYKLIRLIDVPTHLKTITDLFRIDYETELFTGMYLKPKKTGYPTINLFYTGSYQFLGAKSFEKIEKTEKIIHQLIQKCEDGMFTKQTQMCNLSE